MFGCEVNILPNVHIVHCREVSTDHISTAEISTFRLVDHIKTETLCFLKCCALRCCALKRWALRGWALDVGLWISGFGKFSIDVDNLAPWKSFNEVDSFQISTTFALASEAPRGKIEGANSGASTGSSPELRRQLELVRLLHLLLYNNNSHISLQSTSAPLERTK